MWEASQTEKSVIMDEEWKMRSMRSLRDLSEEMEPEALQDSSLTKHEKEEILSTLEQENKFLEKLEDELWDGMKYRFLHDDLIFLSLSRTPLKRKIELAQGRQKFLTKEVAELLSEYNDVKMTTGGLQLPPMLEKSYEPGTTEARMKQAVLEDFQKGFHERKVLKEKLSTLEQKNKFLEKLEDELWEGIRKPRLFFFGLDLFWEGPSWISLKRKIERAQERQKTLIKQCAELLSENTNMKLPPMLRKSYPLDPSEARIKQAVMEEFRKKKLGQKFNELLASTTKMMQECPKESLIYEESKSVRDFLLNEISAAGSVENWLHRVWARNTASSMMKTLKKKQKKLIWVAFMDGYFGEFLFHSEDPRAVTKILLSQLPKHYEISFVHYDRESTIWPFTINPSAIIYEMAKLSGELWTKFATQTLGIPRTMLRQIRTEVGTTCKRLKVKTLEYWRKKNGSTTNKNELARLVAEFQGWEYTDQFDNISFKQMVQQVAGMIPDESWLRFVRIQLELDENEIGQLRMKYADFTQEQKYQITKRWMLHGKLQDLGEENWEIRGQEIEDERNTDFPKEIELL